MAKRAGSRYAEGRRTRDWLKVKTARTAGVRRSAGYTRGPGPPRRPFGSLVLGAYRGGELR